MNITPTQQPLSTRGAEKYLTFNLGEEEYGVHILAVREIIKLTDITPLPNTKGHAKGVINLRGRIIPVIELRDLFNLPQVSHSERTCILVLEQPAAEGAVFGVIVDAVKEVLPITQESTEPPPAFTRSTHTDAITAIAKVKDRVVVLLDIAAALSGATLNTTPPSADLSNSQSKAA